MAFDTAYDLDALMVNTKAATVYAAQERSLFLPGAIIPQVQLPNGSITAQVPVMGTVTAERLTSGSHNSDDFTALNVTDTKKEITANIYAAREVLRDLGGIDPNETGRVLGNAVAAKFDADVVANFQDLTTDGAPGAISVDRLFDVAGQIRTAGETGPLKGIFSPTAAAVLMKAVGGSAFAGGDIQNEAMRSGFIGQIAGIEIYQSAYITTGNIQANILGAVFSEDALRIAMFKNVDLEIQRRASAVGFDIVSSLHAGSLTIDGTRGVKMLSA